MNELKLSTTVYFEVPLGYTIDSYREYLLSLSKVEMLRLATDCGDVILEENDWQGLIISYTI